MSVTSQRERLFDLLADRALVGLEPAEEDELARLLVDFPDAEAVARDIELAAAAVALAGVSEQGIGRMPRGLAAKLEELAQDGMPTTVHRGPELLASAASVVRRAVDEPTAGKPNPLKQTLQMPPHPSQPAMAPLNKTLLHPQAPAPQPVQMPAAPPAYAQPGPPPSQILPFRPAIAAPERPKPPARSGAFVMVAGWVAAAACLLLAIGAWYFRPRTQIVTVDVPTPPPSVTPALPPPTPTPAQERDALLARAGTARLDWSKNAKDPASKQASGDVVWNAAEQRGYMRFRGLAKNDKHANVYQLWIFDKSRDDKYPVDGGVFDVEDETGDVIVPIKAKLPVGEVALFAVTVEKPGGVVVSKRERIVVTAKPAS